MYDDTISTQDDYGIEEPCFNCGSYRHETEFCKLDTIHTCKRTQSALGRCACARNRG